MKNSTLLTSSLLLLTFAYAPRVQADGVKTGVALETKTPIVLDGVLDEAVWKQAPNEGRLTAMTGILLPETEDRSTDLRLAFDDKYVYAAITCQVREDLKSATKTDDVRREGGGKWDNVLEIYFDPGRTLNNFTGIWIYSDGANFGMTDYQHRDPPKGIRYATRAEGHTWTTEIAFPANGRTRLGGQWGFNLIRYAPGAGVLGMWRFIPDSFQSPGCFGRILLGEPKAWLAANVKLLTDDLAVAEKTLKGGAYDARIAKARADLAQLSTLDPQPSTFAKYDLIASDVARLSDAATVKASVPMTEVKYWSCDDWFWEPFSYSGTVALSKMVAAGEKPTFEYKGPIVRKCTGWYPDIGRACEGVKGTGWRLLPRKTDATIGCHGYFGGVFSAGKRYKVEGYFKGKGEVAITTWFNCIKVKTGANFLYKYVTLCKVKLNPEWTKFEAVVELPPYTDDLLPQKGNSMGIGIPKDVDCSIDELRVWELAE